MILPRPVLVVLACLCAVWSALIVLWPDAVIGLTFDDAFYYFEIGYRLALGQGSTFDGIHATNGYHPLWAALCALAHLVLPPSDWTVRVLLILQVGLAMGAAGLLWSGLRWSQTEAVDRGLAALCLGAWMLVPIVTRTHVNGLESGVVAPVHAGLLAIALLQNRAIPTWSAGARWGAGALLALAIWARSDGALLTPLLCLFALPDLVARGGWTRMIPLGLPPLLSLLTFLGLNQVWFGTAMQVSGTLKRVPPGWTGGAILIACAAGMVAVGWASRSRRLEGLTHLGPYLRHTAFYAAFLFAIGGYYTGLQTFARQWYFAPTVLWLTGLLGAAVLDLAAKARADRPDAPPLRAVAPLAGILCLPLLAAAGWTGWQIAHPDTLAVRHADREAATWLDANLSPDARAASWDAGLIGYGTARTLINLDGVVNDVAWLEAMRSGTAGDRLRRERVHWIVNHSAFEEGRCIDVEESLAVLGAPAPIETVMSWPYEQTGRINGGPWGRHQMATCVVRIGP